MNLTRGINLRKIAEMMPGASGAEVKGVCTEAGMYALRERRVHVTQEDFEMAVAKVYIDHLYSITHKVLCKYNFKKCASYTHSKPALLRIGDMFTLFFL